MEETAAEPAPRQLLARPERREALLRAAAGAFAANGYAATSMEDVAAAAGVTRIIVYRHFATKSELYDAVLERVAERLAEELRLGIQPGTAAAARGAVRALLRVAREDPDGFVLLWRHAVREPQFAAHAEEVRRRGVAFAEMVLAPVVIGNPQLVHWAADTMVSYLVGAVLHWLDDGDPSCDDDLAERLSRSLPALVRSWAASADPAAPS